MIAEVVTDKGYHSNYTAKTLKAAAIRSYLCEPDHGRRKWKDDPEAQVAVYGNRRRIRGARSQALQRLRVEYTERSFAHAYETGGMRRTHLRGHDKIFKRLCIHGGAFNLGLVMRKITGRGTPRGLHSLQSAFGALANLLKPVFDLACQGHQAFQILTRKWVLKTGGRPIRLIACCSLHNIGFSTDC